MRSWFRVDTPGRAYAWLLGFGVARTVLDFFWVPQNSQPLFMVLTLFNTTTYQFTLSLFIPWIVGFILERVFSKRVNAAGVLRDSVLVWAVFPAVSILSMVLKSPPTQTIEWFRHIPTLMVEYNFLPAGMIAVIPVLIFVYTRLALRHSAATWPAALASVVGSLYLFYLVYYQYTTQFFLGIIWAHGPIAAGGYHNLVSSLPPLLLAGRFHAAFGPHRIQLPRLAGIVTLLSLAVMLLGLAPSFAPGILPPAPQSPVLSGARWNLRAFQLYDQTDAMIAYGYYLDLDSAGRHAKSFWLTQPGSFFFPNIENVVSDANGLSYAGFLEIDIENSILTLDRKQTREHGDRVRDSLKGHDAIVECAATLAGGQYRCFMLDQNLFTISPKAASWAGETFLALSGTNASVIASAVDGYAEGVIAIGDKRYGVEAVSRQGWEIAITFETGRAVAHCTQLAQYEIMRDVDPQPVESPVPCQLDVRANGIPETRTTVDGLLEWIGTTQGTRQ
jgi:hypothetical protein